MSAVAPPGAAIAARRITKIYGATTALAQADLEVASGEIHGLLGENGAGKSTLVRILAGVEERNGGDLALLGQPVAGGMTDRRRLGCAFIHQELALIPDLSVADNVGLSVGFSVRLGFIDRKASGRAVRQALSQLGADIDADRPVGELTLADQTIVCLTRAVVQGARLIVLDEPTAYLETRQVARLFTFLRSLRASGVACVLISHRLDEVLGVCDRITVLRNGRTVAAGLPAESVSRSELIGLITGRTVGWLGQEELPPGDDTVLDVNSLAGVGFGPVSLHARRGELVAICGLADAGHAAFAEALFGVRTILSGTIRIDGTVIEPIRPSRAIASGIAFLPADRRSDGLATALSARENLFMQTDSRLIRPRKERRLALGILQRFHVRPPAPDREVATFSGGNQQKILLGKWLATDPRVLILNEPTAGIDVGAKYEILNTIRVACRERGAAALIVSSEFEEVANACDRAVIMRHGRIIGTLGASDISVPRITQLAYGAPQ